MQDAAVTTAVPGELSRTGDDRPRTAETTRPDDASPDEAVVAAARTDPAAFRLLYERHWTAVYRYLRARTGRDADAADLAATTFERALVGLAGYRSEPSGFRAWLLRIARNAAIDASRRHRATEPIEASSLIALSEPGPEGRVLAAERSRELRALVAGLPDAQRDAVVLRYGGGLGAREIGSVIGKSEAATQKLLTRALARLKESYRDHD
jgi:RNA polymerase sigma-70 factor (ECF subfamily)